MRYGGELIQISTALNGWSVGLSSLPNQTKSATLNATSVTYVLAQ